MMVRERGYIILGTHEVVGTGTLVGSVAEALRSGRFLCPVPKVGYRLRSCDPLMLCSDEKRRSDLLAEDLRTVA